MANTDEPVYMQTAREYVRYGHAVFTIGTGTVEALLERIHTLEAEAVRLKRTAANDAVMAAEALETTRADLDSITRAAIRLQPDEGS